MEITSPPIGVTEKRGPNLLNKEDVTGRRSRYRRVAPSERPSFRLQARDQEIVSLIHDYRLIPSGHILRLIDGSDQKILRRLQALYHSRYVDRIYQGHNSEVLYALDDAGADLLGAMGRIERRRIDWGQKNREITDRFIEHTLMRSNFRTVFALALRDFHDIRIHTWMTDGMLRDDVIVDHRQVPIIPDDYIVLERRGNKAHSFVEADQSTMSGRRYARKLKGYLGVAAREYKSSCPRTAQFPAHIP